MPTDTFTLNAEWTTRPQDGALFRSGAAPIGPTKILEQVTLDEKNLASYQLSADAAQSVAFAGVVNAHVVIVNCDQPITLQLTSSAGVLQSIPVDDQFVLISRTNAVTALSLVRTPATLTNVSVFVGEMA